MAVTTIARLDCELNVKLTLYQIRSEVEKYYLTRRDIPFVHPDYCGPLIVRRFRSSGLNERTGWKQLYDSVKDQCM